MNDALSCCGVLVFHFYGYGGSGFTQLMNALRTL
jgi:hypothetical protein